MKKHKWTLFIVNLIITCTLAILFFSPNITIKEQFNESMYDSNSTNLLISHTWYTNTNFIVARQEAVLPYLKYELPYFKDSDYRSGAEITLKGHNPFIYLSSSHLSEFTDDLFVITGHFVDESENSFYVDSWHGLGPTTGTHLFIFDTPILFLLLPISIVLNICSFIKCKRKYKVL